MAHGGGQDVRRTHLDNFGLVLFEYGRNLLALPHEAVFPVAREPERFYVFDNQAVAAYFGKCLRVGHHEHFEHVALLFVERHLLQVVAAYAAARGAPEVVEVDYGELAPVLCVHRVSHQTSQMRFDSGSMASNPL